MNASTRVTKVLLPRRRKDVLTRQRLLDCLYDMVDRKLILISAPAGYGKTTLLVDWIDDLEHPVCWYALDRSDQDPHTFLEHLILSIHHRFPAFGERTRRMLAAVSDLSHGAAGVVGTLINEMVDTIPQWFVLVLDDYHRLRDAPRVGALLARLLAYQTDQFLLIVTSRTIPDLPYTIQLAARGEGGGIGQESLRFQVDEIQALFAQNFNLDISDQEAQRLMTQSEGWITGILLSAHAMWQGVFENLVRVNTSNQPVYEYLAQEVLTHQEPSVQAFLKTSSTLEEINPTLCQEALGLENAEDFLTLLKERNLFITEVEARWHRYHHLFRKYLQTQLRQEETPKWIKLHRDAARWFETHDQPEKAVYHYLTVDDYENAALVMEALSQSLYYSGRLETLMQWGASLPHSLHERIPRLMLFQSRAADMLGQWEEALALAEVAERGYKAKQDHLGWAYTLLHRCQIWQNRGEYQKALVLGQEALSLIKETDVPVDYEAHRILGNSHLALGALQEGETHLRCALEHVQEQASDFEQSSVQGALADCLWRQGRWEEAVTIQRQAVAIRQQTDNPAALAGVLGDLGFFLYQIGEHAEALCVLEETLNLARQSGYRRSEAFALVSLSELLRDLGALEQAMEACNKGIAIADELDEGFLSAYSRETLSLIHCCQGNNALAQAAIEEAIKRAKQQNSAYQLGRYMTSWGLVQAEVGLAETALSSLAQAREQLQRIGAHGELLRAQFFTAWALFRASHRVQALKMLRHVLVTADLPTREHLFVIKGRQFLPLLEYAQESEGDSKVLSALLERARNFDHTAQIILQQTSCSEIEKEEPLRIIGFGPGRVERQGAEISISDWGAAATRQMLFYLLTQAPQSREQIAAVLWPELHATKVKANFHTTKFRLKRALGQQPLHFDGQHYQIHPELNYWFDVEAFGELLTETRPKHRTECLQEAISLYQGDFLQDCYDDWCLLLREALREQCLEAIEELAERQLAQRRYRQAIQTLRQGLEMDNLREPLYRHLMRGYTLSGQRGQALRHYRRCVKVLEQELGAPPSTETEILYQRILSGLPLD